MTTCKHLVSVISSFFSRFKAFVEVLALVITAYCECFPLDVHSYFALALSFFGMPGLLSGGFSFVQESAASSFSVSSQT